MTQNERDKAVAQFLAEAELASQKVVDEMLAKAIEKNPKVREAVERLFAKWDAMSEEEKQAMEERITDNAKKLRS